MAETTSLTVFDDVARPIVVLTGTRQQIEEALDTMLTESKRWRSPVHREILERWVLRALSELNRVPGAEHEKRTGRRQAGGGRLTKGS